MFYFNLQLCHLSEEVKSTAMLLGHGPNKAFLVLDSFRATDRNCNSISADVTDDTIENNSNDVLFSENCAGVLYFLILQYRHNIRTLSLNVKLSCTPCETGPEGSPRARFSTCF